MLALESRTVPVFSQKSGITRTAEMRRDFAGMISVRYLYRFYGLPVHTAGIPGVRYDIYNYGY